MNLFSNAYSHVSSTQSRAALLTGKYGWNLGLRSDYDYQESICKKNASKFLRSVKL